MSDIVFGSRTIQRCTTKEESERWQGHCIPDHETDDHWREKIWKGPTIEKVVKGMNDDLGQINDADYQITE